MALGNGSTPNGGVSEKAPVVNGTNMETLPRTGKQTDPNTAFLRAARAGQLDKIQEYLDSGTVRDINTSNANGLNALHLAAKDGHVDIAKELLKRGAVVDSATKKGNTALHIASLAGQEEVVRLLVQHGASLNVQSQNGFTPLYMAAQENHDGVVKYLLSKGANQTLATEDGFTPLAVAMQQGHDRVVAVLLENDTRGKVRLPALHIAAKKDDVKAAGLLLQNEHNPDVTSKSGFTPLHIAAHYGNDKVASLLYDKGANVNYTAKHNITPIHVASKWGKINMVTLLVAKGADIQAKTRDGLTPLHCAARSGHDQVVDMLLENGAPIHAKTKNGLAPLHMAAQGEHVDAARILLYHGAPVDEVTVDYLTALHVAAHCGHVRVAKLLLERGADVNARALNGFTPLHIACKKNRLKMVELLIKHGASIGATTESGLTPLHVASFMGCMNIVIYLLQHDASPDIPTVRGETPLHLAARANQTDIIRILLRNGASVDARAREEQTPLHVASRLGNVDIVMLLLQHGAQPQATTKDLYTPLHIAAKEGQEEVASVLLDNGADLTATTKKGFTPLHLAAKYGHLNVARLLLQRDAPANAQGKNGVSPLHVAAHYDHQPVALLLLDKGASPHAAAKNGHTPLHIAARKNQMDIATTLLEYGAQADAESKAGFTPLHLSAQEGHSDMSSLLLEHQANPNHISKNGLTPLHLCAQEDRVPVAQLLLRAGALKDAQTKSGYTPLHIACHHGHVNMVRLLVEQGADVNPVTGAGYTPLHQAAQQGHVLVISLLLKNKADPNAVTQNGQTALGISNKLGYISVVEELKVVTELTINTTTTMSIEEKYKVMAPEAMQETFMSDSEDEGGDDPLLGDQAQYKYMTVDDMKSLGDDSRMDVTHDEKSEYNRNSVAPSQVSNELIIHSHNVKELYSQLDNVDINRQPVTAGLYGSDSEWVRLERSLLHLGPKPKVPGTGLCRESFLVSFLVDARGGAMRGCRHSGVRVIVPPRCAHAPTRVTCRYVRAHRAPHSPPLMEGEALASRLLELAPVGAKFLGPVIIEVPHFASLRGKQREIIVLRSENGETWKEHTLEANEEAIQDVLNHSFDGEELSQLEDLHTNRITRILTNDFPHYFAVISRIRQEIYGIGPEGGTVSSSAVPLVQAVFPPNALTKKIRVGLQAQAIEPELVSKLLGHGVAVSPIVTVEPRRRKFHKAIMLSMPAPKAHSQGMINQYQGASSTTLRLLCSITGGQNKAVWEDVTGSTPLTFVKDCVSFTTTVSARFWLMDCRNVADAAKMATELYTQAAHVPFMAKFVVFAKRVSQLEARVRVFCMTDDKEDKTLEHQEHFTEVAKSRDIEVLEAKDIYMEFAGNLIPVLQSNDQPRLGFKAFKENRCAFNMRLRDHDEEPVGRIIFMSEAKAGRTGYTQSNPLCTLNFILPKEVLPDRDSQSDLLSINKDHSYLQHGGISKPDTIHRADFRLSDICNLLDEDWEKLALELDIPPSDVELIKEEYPENHPQQGMIMFRLWLRQKANKATGNQLELALNKIGRQDIVDKCICNVELVTDDMEKALAKIHLDQSGFDYLKDELGPSRDTSLRRDTHLDRSYLGSEEKLERSEKSDEVDNENQNSTGKDISDTNVDNRRQHIPTSEIILNGNQEISEKPLKVVVTNKLDNAITTPPPTPNEFSNQEDFVNRNVDEIQNLERIPIQVDDVKQQELFTSTPLKKGLEPDLNPFEILKKNVSDTLTFLHQERNDFLPQEDIIIPSRKDDHISKEIDLEYISLKTPKKNQEFVFNESKDIKKEIPQQEQHVEKLQYATKSTSVKSDLEVNNEESITENRDELVKLVSVSTPSEENSTNKTSEVRFHEDVSPKDNHVENSIPYDYEDSVRDIAQQEVQDVIKQAEEVVNYMQNEQEQFLPNDKEIKFHVEERVDSVFDDIRTNTEDSLDNLESLKDDSISAIQEKSEEAFKFLEQEASSPLLSKPSPDTDEFISKHSSALDDSAAFIQRETESELKDDISFSESQSEDSLSPKSSIPLAKTRKGKDKKKGKNKNKKEVTNDEENDETNRDCKSPTEDELQSKIPIVKGSKVKTIKKHSKDPLKEFATISKDIDWDKDDEQTVTTKIIKTVTTDPIVKTTVTRITSETLPESVKSKIPVLSSGSSPQKDERASAEELGDQGSGKSKIPVLKTESMTITPPDVILTERTTVSPSSTRVIETTTTTIVSPISQTSTKSSTVDSDSDDESRRQSPRLKSILKKSPQQQPPVHPVGSSSGSDIALHEEGGELSSDSEDFYHQEPQYTESTVEEIDPITGAKITKTVRTLINHSIVSPEQDHRQTMQNVLGQFMLEERNPR
ncbi:ankyrin-3-like isoform X3 [Sitophilus oryzae]|uniref:Ankyrin-3-like isoform X3 n=1 Tax=Sitophilus oryzae TaxID=7048 RepID=A0A6J2XCW4_SITOR|nr:ankyrin-3-like isoform X3 [Sitophilus oryzae]